MLDLTKTKCPISILRAREALHKLKPGETLVIKANPDFHTDIAAYCRKRGHALHIKGDDYIVTKAE